MSVNRLREWWADVRGPLALTVALVAIGAIPAAILAHTRPWQCALMLVGGVVSATQLVYRLDQHTWKMWDDAYRLGFQHGNEVAKMSESARLVYHAERKQ